jgi:Flp pilus assembly protein TadD
LLNHFQYQSRPLLKYSYILLLPIALLLIYCNRDPKPNNDWVKEKFLNLHDSVTYVGMKTCLSCHKDVHDHYIHTGMGRSFDLATMERSDAKFDEHALVYDKDKDFYYKPFFEDSILYVLEYRLAGKDTIHKRKERIDYIIGSGHHTNSHLTNRNGYVYQVPITFYTQDGKWDLAPGFEKGMNTRFDRSIEAECLTCHNHFPKQVVGSENKYKEMPRGIECERCHGPGSLHVKEKLKGNIIDTSKFADYTIVNPRHLPIDLQMDICQRCHLQGVAVLNEGKSFYDFRPGMSLADIMQVYLPRFTDSHERFIMASQADRLRLSPCYIQSGKLSCITCHNPHYDVKSREKNRYNEACLDCHKKGDKGFCSAPEPDRKLEDDNCVLCHMPRSGSIDIPHVTITDHNISKQVANSRKRKMSDFEQKEIAQFLGLESLTKKKASDLELAKGYLALYDKYMKERNVLDSVAFYLNRSKESQKAQFKTRIHYLFAAQNYAGLRDAAAAVALADIEDAWTAYRIGEAHYRLQQLPAALPYFEKAVKLRQYNLDFQEKYGVSLARLGQLDKAREIFNFVLGEDRKRPLTLGNLGYMSAAAGDFEKAMYYYDKALALDPDHETSLLNKAALLLHQKQTLEARKILQHLVEKHPDNMQAKQALEAF